MFTKSFATAALALACASEAYAFTASPSLGGMQLRTPATSLSRAGGVSVAAPRADRPLSELNMSGKLAQKYGHLRGADIEPCDKSVQRFYEYFGKPVPFVFRSATNEILYLSHLDMVNARFEYNPIWACGMYSTFDVFFQAIDEETRTKLFESIVKALKMDPAKIKADAESVLAWAQGKSEADVVNAMNGGDQSSEVGKWLNKAKISDVDDFLYTRNFGAGMIKMMQIVGVEPNSANAKKWADAMNFNQATSALTGLSMSRFESDVGVFLSAVEKFQQVMQLYAEVEAREKKKVAERLAEKAEKAAKDAASS